MQKDRLTNEGLKKHFKNNFELANYVINVGRYFIQAGHEMTLDQLVREVERSPHQYTPEMLEAMEQADDSSSDE